jgi:hypothetical protein
VAEPADQKRQGFGCSCCYREFLAIRLYWEHYQFVKMVLSHLNIYFLNQGLEIRFQVSGVSVLANTFFSTET